MLTKINFRAGLITLVLLTEAIYFVLSYKMVNESDALIKVTEQSIAGINRSPRLLETLRLNGLYRGLCTAGLITGSTQEGISESCTAAKNNVEQQVLSSLYEFDREFWRDSVSQSDPLRFFEAVSEWNSRVISELDKIYRQSGLILDPAPTAYSLAEMYSTLLPKLMDEIGVLRGQHTLLKAQVLEYDAFIRSSAITDELQSRVEMSLRYLSSNSDSDDLERGFIEIKANLDQYTASLMESLAAKPAEMDTHQRVYDLFMQGTEIISDLSSIADQVELKLKLEFGERLRRQESALLNKYLLLLLAQATLIFFYWKLFWLNRRQVRAVQRAEAYASELTVSVRELREEREKQAQMLSVVSHELRTPLASSNMIYNELDISNLAKYLPILKENNESVLSIMNDLRMVIRPDQVLEDEHTVYSPAQVIERTLSSLANLAEHKKVTTHLSFDELSAQSYVTSGKALQQIVANLAKNAFLHAEAENVWVNATATPHDTASTQLTVCVEDDGKGISEAFQKTMYEAFSRGETSSDGTGLGLYIIKELAESLNGEISYFSSPKGGAGFKLSARLSTFAEQDNLNEPSYSDEQLTQTLAGKIVLFAEDQLTIQVLTKGILTKAGAEVTVASNGQVALSAFYDVGPDIVMTDAMMPEMDGYELSARLRAEGYKGPIIAVTAATIGDERERLIAAGADAVLPKPIDLGALKIALADWDKNQTAVCDWL